MAYGHITEKAAVEEKITSPERLEAVRLASNRSTPVVSAVATSPAAVEAKVREYFADIPIMAEIARCESTYRHRLSDGSVLRGYVDQADTGVMQINLRYHAHTAKKLGLDLENIYDNMAYARYLYERQGTQPWNASAPCWRSHQLAANY